MTEPPSRWRWVGPATWCVLAAHAASLVVLCFQQKLTPDEANYVLAGCILRHGLRFDAYNTVLHGPLAFWPNQLGVWFADPKDLATYVPFGRLGFVPFTVLAALAVKNLARQAFDARLALAAVLLWAANPLVLAHGSLMTADMALTCTSLWTLERTWRWLQAPTLPRLSAIGVLLGLTLATKYLGLFLLPTLALLLAWNLGRGFAPSLLWSHAGSRALPRVADAGLAAGVVAVVAWLTLYTCYLWQPPRFAVQLPPPGVVAAAEDASYGPKSAALRSLALTMPGRVLLQSLPEPFVRGVDYQKLISEESPTFFGDRVGHGFWAYYLVAFGTKLPLVFLLLLAVGTVVRGPPWPPRLPGVVLAAIAVPLVFLSLLTRLQIGVRYALPVLPFLCLLAARGLAWLARRGGAARLLALVGAIALLVHPVLSWPSFLTTFNALAPRPYLWFKDSTLDWRVPGAPDRELAALRQRHPQATVIDGAIGPSLGKFLVHGEQLAPVDPRDPTRVHHWLRAFWPTDSAGAWYLFEVDDASYAAAVAAAADRARAAVEFASALIGAARYEHAAELLDGSDDRDAPEVAAALADVRSGEPARQASGYLRLGRPDLVPALGDAVPRAVRARAWQELRRPQEVIALLQPTASDLQPNEVYLLATALAEVGRGDEALALLEGHTPADPQARTVHERIVRRLREVLAATRKADQASLRR